jgi:hypothetical protein
LTWIAPRTWTAAEGLSPSMLNINLRDNMNALRAPDYRVYLRLTHDQSVPYQQWTAIDWDDYGAPLSNGGDGKTGTSQNPTALWSSSQKSRLLVPVTGYYRLSALVEFSLASPAGVRGVAFAKNDENRAWLRFNEAVGSGTTRVSVVEVRKLTVADGLFCEVQVYQNAPSADMAILGQTDPNGLIRTRCCWQLLGEA